MSDPVPFFRDLAAREARCFWLDGGGAREWSGSRSVVGWLEPDDVSLTYDAARREVVRHAGGRSEVAGDDVFAVLADELAAGPDDASWFGYLGYACRPDLPAATGGGLPDAVWMRPSHVRMFRHDAGVSGGGSRRARPAPGTADEGSRRARPTSDDAVVPEEYAAAFARVQEHLHAGNTYEVNLTHRLDVDSDLDPATAYLRLRDLNPAPYAGFLQHDVPGHRAWLLSSSPERYALVTADRVLETKPIKGTTPRGATPADDELLRARLGTESKFRAENLMIVDLLRNDLSMVCEPGSVEVPALMQVESYENVHQLVSTVRGRLADGVSTLDALRALFPAGSMTGAPKLRTMQVIEEVEATPRGPYAGAFGWLSADGRADLGVVIRALVTAGDGRYRLGTGGGITVQSDVADEHAETRWKADRMLRVFDD
ncbi:anthranilate synthase component I family protein [Nocardioides sp. GCM10027113]|uniref:anthranilate synthase component I family protein n=1 Tax=unclassified Nocardioides TaxID=2615069 RepID=UPI00361BE88E